MYIFLDFQVISICALKSFCSNFHRLKLFVSRGSRHNNPSSISSSEFRSNKSSVSGADSYLIGPFPTFSTYCNSLR